MNAVPRAFCVCALVAVGTTGAARAERFLDYLTVQQSLDTKLVAKPALFQYVAKKDMPDVWVVNLGAKFDVMAATERAIASYLELGPSFDYQRNTAADKEQNAIKAGLSLDAISGDVQDWPAIAAISSTVNYAHDGVKKTSGLQAKTSVSLVTKGCGKRPSCVYLPSVTTNLVIADIVYTPLLGAEYDHVFKATTDVDKGYAVRVVPRQCWRRI